MGEASAGFFGTIGGGLMGEWNEDPTLGMIGTDTIVSIIPVLDQASDARDLAAHLYFMTEKKQYDRPMRWIALVFSLIGLFPEVGSAIKSASKFVLKGVREAVSRVGDLLAPLLRVMPEVRDIGRLRDFLSSQWARFVVFGKRIWTDLLDRAASLASSASTILERTLATRVVGAVQARWQSVKGNLGRIRDLSSRRLDGAFSWARQQWQEGLSYLERRFGRRAGPESPELKSPPKGPEVFEELAVELGSSPASKSPHWSRIGIWRTVKPEAYKLIFGSKTLPDINRPGQIRMTLGHIVEKSTGGQHSLANLMPQLSDVNVRLSGIYGRKQFALPLAEGGMLRITAINGKPITGSLRDAFLTPGLFSLDEQRAIGLWITGLVITPSLEAELATLVSRIPHLSKLVP